MVAIEGGRTRIGTDRKTVERLIQSSIEAQQRGTSLAAETPQHTVEVDPFFLMVSEVTNEQYEVFVRASGHKPPEHWADKEALEAARKVFIDDQARRRQEAHGRSANEPGAATFDREAWWSASWRQRPWSVPAGQALLPVTFVSHEDARAYARWAGLRLMSEAEFQRAVRGDGDRSYPWGDELAADGGPIRAATIDRPERRGEPSPVGSYPGGASEEGCYDLVGNVWEWTTTPFTAYPGYEPLTVEVGRGAQKTTKIYEVAWDPDARVCVGGSFQNDHLAGRAATRRRTERVQTTDAVGFRCAASTRVGSDIAAALLERGLPVPASGRRVEYRADLSLALDRWRTRGDAAGGVEDAAAARDDAVREAGAGAAETVPPPGYAVIEGYDYIVFIPARAVPSANDINLRKDSLAAGAMVLGVLSTTVPVLQPELAPGTYTVAFRGQGEAPSSGPPMPEPPALDSSVDNLIVYDDAGRPLCAIPAPAWEYTRLGPGQARIVTGDVAAGEGGQAPARSETWLHFDAMLESLTPSRGFRVTQPLRFEDGVLVPGWRL
jgi:formylglycine-generating enzyme required for sulfatase activity